MPERGYIEDLQHWFLRTVGLLPHIALEAFLLLGWFLVMHGVHRAKGVVVWLLGGQLEPWEMNCLDQADHIMAYGTLAIVLVCIFFPRPLYKS